MMTLYDLAYSRRNAAKDSWYEQKESFPGHVFME